MEPRLSRRQFLAAGAAGAVFLSLVNLRLAALASPPDGTAPQAAEGYEYRSWEDLYRQKWKWDRVVRCTHLRANCFSACAWDVFVRDGLVWREEQRGSYGRSHAAVPDFSPRGCQKGACYSALSYSASRLKYPLKRLGPRGSGRFKRITWEEALREVAEAIVDVCADEKRGPECIIYDHGTSNLDVGPASLGEMWLFSLLGATFLDSYAGVGDLAIGAVQTWGMFNVEGTSDDWFNSDYIVVWMGNPSYTRIPDLHFMLEARYRGAKLVVVAPDYNATATRADLWVNPKVGTDPALALALAQVIVSEGLYDAAYVKEQTDLPLLVRLDNGRFLRQSDLEKGGKEDVFYLWDRARQGLEPSPGSKGLGKGRLGLDGLDPALEGRFTVVGASGDKLEVSTVFSLLEAHLARYTPEEAAKITGVGPGLIRQMAREMARAPAAMIFASWGACKYYHSDLMQRALILLMALTGNQGRPGGGMRLAAWYGMSGGDRWATGIEPAWWQRLLLKFVSLGARELEEIYTEVSKKELVFSPSLLWLYLHGGLASVLDGEAGHDGALRRPFRRYVEEALEKGWMPVYPSPPKAPEIFIFTGANPLRRWPAPQVVERELWRRLRLIVDVNFRMCTSGLKADLLLPAAGYYEKRGIKYLQSYLPYVVVGDRAVEPLFESKGEWEIFGLLAKAIQEQALARGVDGYTDALGKKRSLASIFDRWSDHGKHPPEDDTGVLDRLLRDSEVTRGASWSKAAKEGMVPIKSTGSFGPTCATASDFKEGETVVPSRWFVEGKQPWPTLTGRQQFYIDHPWFLELGEALPTHKELPRSGGDYPLRLTGGHTRWSIHAIWRDDAYMLKLQRGEPVAYAAAADCAARGIKDGDRARIYNDVGSFEVQVKVSPAVQPGQVIVYHAWEPYQFRNWQGNQEPVACPWKPLHLVGDYGQLHYRFYYAAPVMAPRGAAVEMEKAAV